MTPPLLFEPFEHSTLDARLTWYCPPISWESGQGWLTVRPGAKTDYWQKTHYGFSADNGPFLYLPVQGDFVLATHVRFFPANQYDQAGLLVRLSPDCWLKTSVEFETEGPNRLGAVVTTYGYSDWSTQDFSPEQRELELRISRHRDDYLVEYRLPQPAGAPWVQIRMAHLPNPDAAPVQAGLYACSPIAAGYRADFAYLRISQETDS